MDDAMKKAQEAFEQAVTAKASLKVAHGKQIEAARKKRTKELAEASKAVNAAWRAFGKMKKDAAVAEALERAGQKKLFEEPKSDEPNPST